MALLSDDGTEPTEPPGGGERLSADEIRTERAVLALRTRDGIPSTAASELATSFAWAEREGLLERARRGDAASPGGVLALTLRGRLLSNEVFARLV